MKKYALLVVTLLSLSWTIGCEPPKPAAPKEEAPAAAPADAPAAAPAEAPKDAPAEPAKEAPK